MIRPWTLARLLVVVATLAAPARAGGPADPLLDLVPPDSGVTLVVEGLRDHARAILGSPLAGELGHLPAVEAWKASEGPRQFARARRQIVAALGVQPEAIRDELLGDAAVLALVPGPDGAPGTASGLLLTRVRDRSMLDRLIAAANRIQRGDGGLVEVVDRRDGPDPYTVRDFREGTRPDEAYAILDGNLFAWSNSEAVIRGVIDRHAGDGGGLEGRDGFRDVRSALPEGAVASLFVDPAFLARVMAADPKPRPPGEERAVALIDAYLRAVDYAGAALEWRDGLILHEHEAIAPDRLGPALRRWADRDADIAALLRRVPESAVAVGVGVVDLAAVAEGARALVPEDQAFQVDNVRDALRGLLLGRDPRSEVLPDLGPGVLGFVDAPGDAQERPSAVVALTVGEGSRAPIANLLRTVLALTALEPKNTGGPARVVEQEVSGARVVSLDGGRGPFAFTIDDDVLLIGSTAEGVATGLASRSEQGGARLRSLRSAYFPQARSFLYLDLERLLAIADRDRDAVAARWNTSREDLDNALALIGPFRAAFATSVIGPGFASVHRRLGLIARPAR